MHINYWTILFLFAVQQSIIFAFNGDELNDSDLFVVSSSTNVGSLFRVEGKVNWPDSQDAIESSWISDSKILFNYGQFSAFLRNDGSFIGYVPSGSYIVEVSNKDYIFDPVRVDVNSKGKVRARRLLLLQPNSVSTVSYPLKFMAKQRAKYFQTRETWRITDFIFSPMVLMMVLPLLCIMILPKLVDTSDPELQKEMRESLQMPKYDIPELGEVMANWFGGGKKPKVKTAKKIRND